MRIALLRIVILAALPLILSFLYFFSIIGKMDYLLALVLFLFVFLCFSEYLHQKEEKELLILRNQLETKLKSIKKVTEFFE